jgi:hypothetical protein
MRWRSAWTKSRALEAARRVLEEVRGALAGGDAVRRGGAPERRSGGRRRAGGPPGEGFGPFPGVQPKRPAGGGAAGEINHDRQTLLKCKPAVTVELVKLFARHHACPEESEQLVASTKATTLLRALRAAAPTDCAIIPAVY